MKSIRQRKDCLPILLLVFLLLSLIPLLQLGQYARAAADDYCYGIHTAQAIRNGHGLWAAVCRTMWGYYKSWQGSFAAMGLMSLTPCILSEGAYWLTPVVMLASLILGTVKLTGTLVQSLGGTWRETVYIAVPLLFLSIQFVPSPLNSFYWWNGAVYYTFTYGISLLYLERWVALFLRTDGRRWSRLLSGCLYGVLVGGSNYVSALLCALLAGCGLLLAWYQKRAQFSAVLLFCGEVLPFLANMAAPGNQVRQATVSAMPPLQAICCALAQAAIDLIRWPNWLTLLIGLAWIPLLLRLARGCSLSFRLPGFVLLGSFLLFAAQNSPHFYAVSTAGPPRLRNIVYFSSLWLFLINEWYLLGWLQRVHLKCVYPRRWFKGLAAVGCLLVLCCAAFYAPAMCSIRCISALSDGTAATYAAERDSRLPALKNPLVSAPVFPPLSAKPELLYQDDITADPANWKNNVLAIYWGKQSVTLAEPPS